MSEHRWHELTEKHSDEAATTLMLELWLILTTFLRCLQFNKFKAMNQNLKPLY